uniref:NADH-ubiquinone oxidoreductase chain 3 n=1 Tax=Sympiezomias velatus TaxID=2044628 RepID=A0A343L6Q2_9CUCU|nr:NADH dehydrogenase subunit 3 [Sympiezomias velatus]
MLMLFIMSKLIWVILGIFILILNLIAKKTFADREKNSPFECGFDPKSSARVPFSLHFFLLAVIFIIFDVELTLILPMTLVMKISSFKHYILTTLMFLLMLLIGLYHEWNQGALNWAV